MKPFLSIWISPKKTFEYLSSISAAEDKRTIYFLYALIMIGIGIPRFADFSDMFGTEKHIGILFGILISGLFGILIFSYVISLVYWFIGKILKGAATKNQIRLVVAYSFIPFLIYLVFGFALIIASFFTKNFELIYYQHPFTYYVVYLLLIRNLIYGLSYFNKYSYAYSLINIFIPTAIAELLRQLIS